MFKFTRDTLEPIANCIISAQIASLKKATVNFPATNRVFANTQNQFFLADWNYDSEFR